MLKSIRNFRLRATSLLVVLGLAGCAAAFVPWTNDPHEKLNWANGLVHIAERPLPAERLIQEAIAIFQQQNDEVGLADAYRAYGSFFSSSAIARWKNWYGEHGFRDKTATLENRYLKSIEYFEKSIAIYTRYKRYDGLVYANLNMGLTYEEMGDRDAACLAFEKSAKIYRENISLNPNATIDLPQGVATYDELLASHKQRVGCRH